MFNKYDHLRCPNCGGKIIFLTGLYRTRTINGIVMNVSNNIGIPTCSECGKEIIIPGFSERLNKIIAANHFKQSKNSSKFKKIIMIAGIIVTAIIFPTIKNQIVYYWKNRKVS